MTRKRNRLISTLASPRFAAGLIVALMALQILSVVVPQSTYMGAAYQTFAADNPQLARVIEATGLDSLFGGLPFAVLCVLLVLSTISCMWLRMRRWFAPTVSDEPDWSPQSGLLEARDALELQRWRVIKANSRGFVAQKGEIGSAGSILMHLALIVIVIGGAATALTSFRGQLIVAEGQEVVDRPSSYRTIIAEPKIGPGYTNSRIGLDKTTVTYDGPTVVSLHALMHATSSSGDFRNFDVRVNHPMDFEGKSYLVQDGGYAVAMVVARDGEDAVPVVVSLAQRTATGWQDTIDLGGVKLDLSAAPDVASSQGRPPLQRFNFTSPRLRVVASIDGSVTARGTLARGDRLRVTPATTITFEELRTWNRYLVRREPARWITYTGFWLAVIGMLVRFAVPERRMAVDFDDNGLKVRLASRPWNGVSAEKDERLRESLLRSAPSNAQPAITEQYREIEA